MIKFRFFQELTKKTTTKQQQAKTNKKEIQLTKYKE